MSWTQDGKCNKGKDCKYKHGEKMKGSRPKKRATPALINVSDSEDEMWEKPICLSAKRNTNLRFNLNSNVTEYEVDPRKLGFYPKKEAKKLHRKLDLNGYHRDSQDHDKKVRSYPSERNWSPYGRS